MALIYEGKLKCGIEVAVTRKSGFTYDRGRDVYAVEIKDRCASGTIETPDDLSEVRIDCYKGTAELRNVKLRFWSKTVPKLSEIFKLIERDSNWRISQVLLNKKEAEQK